MAIVSTRAGNVIGGGDWAEDRLVVDVVSSFLRGETPVLRHPGAVRPWQFVLEPLAGYLLLAQRAYAAPNRFAGGWNFGPDERDCQTVAQVVNRMAQGWGAVRGWLADERPAVHEAQMLVLDATKARVELGWRPRLELDGAIDWTVEWYRAYQRGDDVGQLARDQIARYEALPAPA